MSSRVNYAIHLNTKRREAEQFLFCSRFADNTHTKTSIALFASNTHLPSSVPSHMVGGARSDSAPTSSAVGELDCGGVCSLQRPWFGEPVVPLLPPPPLPVDASSGDWIMQRAIESANESLVG